MRRLTRNMAEREKRRFSNKFKVIWCILCGILFWRVYVLCGTNLEYAYLHEMLGIWFCIARGSAVLLNLHCAVVLLPACTSLVRLFNHAIRKIDLSIGWMKIDMKNIHVFIGYVIILFSVIHVVAHGFNTKLFCDNFNTEIIDVNPFPNPPKFVNIIFGTIAGVTGVVMTGILCLLVVTSFRIMRRRFYNSFWYSHRTFVLFYILLVLHGVKGPLRKQVNTDHHIPGCYRNISITLPAEKLDNSSNIAVSHEPVWCSEMPIFDHFGSQSWMWIGVPLFMYLCDLTCRIFRRAYPVQIKQSNAITTDILEISIVEKDLKVRPGQHVFINCGKISTLEWHPFSVVQVPTSFNSWELKLWIKSAGDWTDSFVTSVVNNSKTCPGDTERVRLDGPYNSRMEDVIGYKYAVCIAGGLGVTPFLAHLTYLAERKKESKLKQLDLICVIKEEELLKYSINLVQNVDNALKNMFRINVAFYFTGGSESTQSTITSTTLEVHNGRPDLDKIFADILKLYKRSTIGVFACGPPSLCADVKQLCNKCTTGKKKFVIHKETF